MFVIYQKGYPQGIPCNKQTAEAWGLNEGDLFKCNPYLQIKCVDGSHSMWVPSINDILAEDWEILKEDEDKEEHYIVTYLYDLETNHWKSNSFTDKEKATDSYYKMKKLYKVVYFK